MTSKQTFRFLSSSILSLSLLLAVGCADPTADAPQAEVEPAAEVVAEAPAEAVDYPLNGSIGFVGSKVTGSHEGGFESFEGTVSVVGDDIEASSVQLTIDTTSLWADADRLTGHLKSDDFFGVETYPTSSFASTAITANEAGNHTVTGNLELHGVTQQISFPATITLTEEGYTAQAEFAINRFDFEIVYPGKKDDLIREDVLIRLDLNSGAAPEAGEAAEATDDTEGAEPAEPAEG